MATPAPVRVYPGGRGISRSLALDVQPRPLQYGLRGYRAHAETGTFRLAPRLASAKNRETAGRRAVILSGWCIRRDSVSTPTKSAAKWYFAELNPKYGELVQIADRYNSFQQEAVENIAADFRDKPSGRFLLVIPTGGGKTTTAVKAVSKLYRDGQLAESDRVLWVVHREELRRQAQDSFNKFAADENEPELPGKVDILMLSGVKQYIQDHPTARLAVIDEAHHVAARSYQPLFERLSLGILGLTATPSRHDGQPLEFDRESFSIGFPDLISIGVLLKPNVIRVDGGKYDITDIGNDDAALEVLNNKSRNERIVSAIFDNQDKISKAIIYVGTRKHALDLYEILKSSSLVDSYDSISLILGGERRRFVSGNSKEIIGETRKDFIAFQKAASRSILVNVDVLTEGYDDPTVNTVVMARPTSSKLVYMQAMGRAVRIDPKNLEKEAFVLEVVDELPNIRYRIDNRWLFSDISDLLEPQVEDIFYGTDDDLRTKIDDVFQKYQVGSAHRTVPEYTARDRITMLLFKTYVGNGQYRHIPLVITNDTRQAASNFFNLLASRMVQLSGLNIEQVLKPLKRETAQFPILGEFATAKLVVQAMENAWEIVRPKKVTESGPILAGSPWITFVAFRFQMSAEALGPDLLAFTEDMLNKETVRSTLRTASIPGNFFLVRFPQPLRGSWGVFLPPEEFAQVQAAVTRLESIETDVDGVFQWHQSSTVLATLTVAVEHHHIQSLATIVREGFDYFRALER